MTLLTDEIRAFIGREVTYDAPEELGTAAIRYFALATDDDNPLYRDDEWAKTTRFGGIVAPPTLVCETNQYMNTRPREDGSIGHDWDLPVENARMLRAGNEYEFLEPVKAGDRLTVTWKVADIYERESGRGNLLFVISEARYFNQNARLLVINRETNVFQELLSADG